MIGRWIKSMFAAKTQEPPEQTIDQFVDELVAIQNQAVNNQTLITHGDQTFPTVQWSCSECDSRWFCFGYSREFTPAYCPYCGVKYALPSESELAKANFRDERKGNR